jgi:molybdate transport repressor ModE-like protein
MSNDEYWDNLSLRQLEVLHAIAEGGTLWAAAESLDLSQSAVSHQLSALEAIVGERLVERAQGRRQAALTEAGTLLLRHADAIIARLRAAHADFTAFAAGAAGRLRVGSYQSVGARIVPALLREFADAWPDVEVQLAERPADDQLLEAVEHGELDLAFTMYPLNPGPFEAVELLRDPYVLAVPADWEIGTSRPPRLRDLRDVPLIGYRSCHASDQAEGALRRRGVEPRIVFRTDDNGTLQGLVAARMGAALAPLLTLDPNDPRVRILWMEELPVRSIVIAWHRDRYRSPAARAFVETAQRVSARVQLAIDHSPATSPSADAEAGREPRRRAS